MIVEKEYQTKAANVECLLLIFFFLLVVILKCSANFNTIG